MNPQYFTNSKAPTLAITYDATVSASTEVAIASGASYIEVTALDKGVFLKWGATASSSAFDEFIAPNVTRLYIIPTGATSVQFIEESATAKLVVIQK